MGGWEIGIVAGVVFLLFGVSRLPRAARDLGRSVRILREEVGPELGGDQ